MGISLRTSSTTAGGTQNSVSFGGRPSASAASTSNGAYFDDVTTAQNDSGHTDYRCLFLYNDGTTTINNVKVICNNKAGGSTVTVALSSVATNTFASYVTGVISSETNAPTQITGSFASSVTVGTLAAGQVKAVWFKRVTASKTSALSNDNVNIVISGQEVIPDPS